jgi:hypothetical protein
MWWGSRYTAGDHFIPIFGNLTDLEPKLDAAVADPTASAAMAARWLARGRHILSMECILEYIGELLRAYAKLQRFSPLPRPTWGQHYLNSSTHYFLESSPPDIATCSPFF